MQACWRRPAAAPSAERVPSYGNPYISFAEAAAAPPMRGGSSSTLALGLALVATAANAVRIVHEAGELRLQDPEEVGSVVTSPLPHTYLKPSDIPAEWNPHDIDGITLVTSDLNQHIPQCA